MRSLVETWQHGIAKIVLFISGTISRVVKILISVTITKPKNNILRFANEGSR